MHDTALEFGKLFFETYYKDATGLTIVEIGAQNVNGSLGVTSPPGNKYIGVDCVEGADVVLTDPYSLPFGTGSVDACVSSSVFEHSEFFWVLFNEILRILKPNGLLYLNMPSNGEFHRHTIDCWRFYPESGVALQNWARKSGINTVMLESFTGRTKAEMWNDFVSVYVKDEAHVADHPRRMLDSLWNITNGLRHGSSDFINFTRDHEDRQKQLALLDRENCIGYHLHGLWNGLLLTVQGKNRKPSRE
jgi:SAM-dependent methyltransferase